jgi:hypothetical protein
MPTKVITVSVDAQVEEKFRKTARAIHGKKRGYLGRALTDAMENWTREKEQTDSVVATLQLLDEGINLGGLKYKNRDELHDR